MNKLTREKHQAKYNGQEMMEYVANAKFEDLPAEVVTRAKHIVMDNIAVILAGRKTRVMFNITWDHMAPAGDVTPVGCEIKTTAAMAACLNAAHAQTHDYNDGLNNSGMLGGAYHPGRTVVSTALAVGQKVHASGKDILLAVVLGIEVAARMRNLSHSCSVAEIYSSAVVAVKLMGGNAEQIRSACTFAGFFSLGDKSADVSWPKPATDSKAAGPTINVMRNAFISRNGVEAAEFAMQGYEGPGLNDSVALSGRYSSCGLGKEYQCMNMYFKPWPCCRKTHGAIDAVLSLRNEHGVKPEEIEAIRVFQQITGMYVDAPFNEDSDVNYGGQFSLQYTIACAFLDGNVELRHFRWPDRKAPKQYVELGKKVKVIADNSLDGHNAIAPNHCIVEVDLKNGETLSLYCPYPLGSEPNGMTEEQRIAKLRDCAEDLTEAEKDRLVNWILTLDSVEAH